MREIRYRAIAEDVRRRVVDGEYAAGSLLPSEAELGAEFDASRVTVRRALEVLRDDGLVDARQGFGWFVASAALRQSLGRLATLESQLVDGGIRPERRILEFAFERASRAVKSVLGAEQVLRVKRLNLA
ncbi:MAG: GntR family transcriptional regulator, partial [Actinomycetota bacterium]